LNQLSDNGRETGAAAGWSVRGVRVRQNQRGGGGGGVMSRREKR